MLNQLSRALEEDPEVDLLSALRDFYSKQLAMLRQDGEYYPAKSQRLGLGTDLFFCFRP